MSEINTEDYDFWFGANTKEMSFCFYATKPEDLKALDCTEKAFSESGHDFEQVGESSLPVDENDFFMAFCEENSQKKIGLFSDHPGAERYLMQGLRLTNCFKDPQQVLLALI